MGWLVLARVHQLPEAAWRVLPAGRERRRACSSDAWLGSRLTVGADLPLLFINACTRVAKAECCGVYLYEWWPAPDVLLERCPSGKWRGSIGVSWRSAERVEPTARDVVGRGPR